MPTGELVNPLMGKLQSALNPNNMRVIGQQKDLKGNEMEKCLEMMHFTLNRKQRRSIMSFSQATDDNAPDIGDATPKRRTT